MLKQLKKIWIGCVYALAALLLISCRPANKELSDAEAKKAAVSELNKILELGREPESVILYYQNNEYQMSGSISGEREYRAYWRCDCSFTEGEDYQVWLNAADGPATNIFKYPEDWFDNKKEHGTYLEVEPVQYSETEIVSIAENYCRKAGYEVKDSFCDFKIYNSFLLQNPGNDRDSGRTDWPIDHYRITIYYSGEGSATIALCADDLSFLGAWFVPYQ